MNVGPFHVPVTLLLMTVSLLIAAGIGHLVGRDTRTGIGKVLIDMVLVGLLAARTAFVAIWFEQYRHAPWSIFDILDGGFTPWVGVVAGSFVVIWRGWQSPELRRPLNLGLLAGVLAWEMSGAPGMIGISSQATLPTMSLNSLAGEPTNLTAMAKGKPMVVNLWASWCPPCRREMPVLAVAQQQEMEVTFVFANQGEDRAAVQRYLTGEEMNLANVLLDSATELGLAIGSTALPTTLFYDANGRLVDAHVGALSAASLASKLNELSTSKNLSVKK